MLTFLPDWQDVKDHQDFANSEAFKTLGGELVNVVSFENGPPLVSA